MKILVVDNEAGNGQLSFIMRAQDDGHTVRWYFSKPLDWKAKPVGKGIATIVADWRDHVRWADLIVLGDNTKHLDQMDALRRQGRKIIGATQASAAWELDRTVGQQIFRKHGIPVPAYREFSNYDQAIAYVKREGRPFVSKPNGDTDDKALSYVAKSPADMIYQLQKWKGGHKHKDAFILQEKVSGVEMAVGAWVGSNGFTAGWLENFETKKLFAGDLGPNTGEMGTTIKHVGRSRLAEKVLKPLEDAIVATGHTGYVDVNTIVDEDGTPWPLEFTMRFGYPTWPIQQALIDGDIAEWLMDLTDGRDAKPWSRETAVGVVMATGSFPHGRIPHADIVGIPIYGAEDVLDDLHFAEVQLGKAPLDVGGKVVDSPCFLTAGDYILTATGRGASVVEARYRAYSVLGKLSLPSSPFWRNDIGLKLKTCLPRLADLGYAKAWRYAKA